MPHWSGWKKLALVCIVCGAHLAFLSGFNLNLVLGKSSNIGSISTEKFSITLRQAANKPLADALEKPQEQTSVIDSQAADTQTAATSKKSVLPETPFWAGLQNRDYFLDAGAVDKTAEPDDVFESQLGKILPLNFESIVLEFWIEKDGLTVDVRCIEGACTDEVVASLLKLVELKFTPAVKDGETVANRKVIQIDPRSNFGF